MRMPYGTLHFSPEPTPSDPKDCPVLIIGQPKHLKNVSFENVGVKLGSCVPERVFKSAVDVLHGSSTLDTFHLYQNVATMAALPSKCSRHNTPSRAHTLTKLVKNWSNGTDAAILVVCEYPDVFASACAIARAFPRFSRKTGSGSDAPFKVSVEFLLVGSVGGSEGGIRGGRLTEEDVQVLQRAAEGIQLTARIVDTPCNEMHTDAFLEEVRSVGQELGIVPTIISGEDLESRGFGGIFSVGKAAIHPPALAVLSHTPPGAKETIAWVGKGIVYDTGGLSIKGKTAMPGMKRDCGGAAAILGAFATAVKLGFKENLHAVFCLAENAVGPKSTRPDDIITLYSGRTVEVNNTDAEGRLVLGDGVAYAHKDLKADVIVDMATLTGAQGTATGKFHAAVVSNRDEWEQACVRAGITSGDLVHPLPFCPELHFSEFSSAVADMKNSVADRCNAQSSCAALFVFAHLGFDFPGSWVHLDIASPVHCGERATGYGVALLSLLFGHLMANASLLRLLSPLSEKPDSESNTKKMRLE